MSAFRSDKVPSAVQDLLTSSQRLLEVLRFWSVEEASEGDVSDMYVKTVKFGNELNLTVKVFAEHQIDLSDIHSIPEELRSVLEHCLSEAPSHGALDAFMPEVRCVLFKLLKVLQERHESWRMARWRLYILQDFQQQRLVSDEKVAQNFESYYLEARRSLAT